MASKASNAALRQRSSCLAWVRPHNPILSQFAERLISPEMTKQAVIGAGMHKLTELIYGVIRTGKPFDSDYSSAPRLLTKQII